MTSQPTPPALSVEEIRCLQNRKAGWKNVWQKIVVALFGRTDSEGHRTDGLLRQSVRKTLNQNDRENNLDDIVSYIFLKFDEKAQSGRLLLQFDPDYPNANIFSFLCAKRNIRILLKEYRRKETCVNAMTRFFSTTSETEEHEEPRSAQHALSPLETFDAVQENQRLVLRYPDGKTFDTPTIYAGLQLYRGLDRNENGMNHLLSQVEVKVRQSANQKQKLQTAPDWIESEHDSAQERIRKDYERIQNKRYHLASGGVKNLEPRAIEKNRRDLERCEVERLLYPLVNEQVASLFNIAKNTAEKQKERYKEKLPELLPDLGEFEKLMETLPLCNEGEDHD